MFGRPLGLYLGIFNVMFVIWDGNVVFEILGVEMWYIVNLFCKSNTFNSVFTVLDGVFKAT